MRYILSILVYFIGVSSLIQARSLEQENPHEWNKLRDCIILGEARNAAGIKSSIFNQYPYQKLAEQVAEPQKGLTTQEAIQKAYEKNECDAIRQKYAQNDGWFVTSDHPDAEKLKKVIQRRVAVLEMLKDIETRVEKLQGERNRYEKQHPKQKDGGSSVFPLLFLFDASTGFPLFSSLYITDAVTRTIDEQNKQLYPGSFAVIRRELEKAPLDIDGKE